MLSGCTTLRSEDPSEEDCERACAGASPRCLDGQLIACGHVAGCGGERVACDSGACFDGSTCAQVRTTQWGSGSLAAMELDEDGKIWMTGRSSGLHGKVPSAGSYVQVVGFDRKVLHYGPSPLVGRIVGMQLRKGGAYVMHNGQRTWAEHHATLVEEFGPNATRVQLHDVGLSLHSKAGFVFADPPEPGVLGELTLIADERFTTVNRGKIEDVGRSWSGPLHAIAPGVPDGVVLAGVSKPDADDNVELVAARHDGAFVVRWEARWGARGHHEATAVGVSDDGSVYVAGTTDVALGHRAFGGLDWFVTKISPAGTVDWTIQWGTAGWDAPADLAASPAGVTVVGQVDGEFVEAAPGNADVALLQLGPDGEIARQLVWGTDRADRATAVVWAADGRLAVGGETEGSLGGLTTGHTDVFLSVLGPATDEGVATPLVSVDTDAPSRGSLPIAPQQHERSFVAFRERHKGRMGPLPGTGWSTELEVDTPEGGTLDIGAEEPVLSWDGRWLAYHDEGALEVSRIDGTVTHTLAEPWENSYFPISGFSPDSNALLFRLDDHPEDRALDSTFEPHFVVATLEPFSTRPVPALEGFTQWSEDPNVIFRSGMTFGEDALLAFDLRAGRERLIQPLRLGQPDFVGAFLAYAAGGPEDARTSSGQLRTVRIGGGEARGRSEVRGWATYQWPKLSPDRAHLAYCERSQLRIVGLQTEMDLSFSAPSRWARSPACGVGGAGWISPTEFLYHDESDQHVWKVDVTTSTKQLEQRFVDHLAIAGYPP